jgi:hypothetical protein
LSAVIKSASCLSARARKLASYTLKERAIACSSQSSTGWAGSFRAAAPAGLIGMGLRWRQAAEWLVRAYEFQGQSNCEISKNLPGQDLVDFTVPRHRLGATGSGLVKDVMPSSVAKKNATSLLQFSDQISPFQATTSSPTLRIPGRSSLENS